MSRQWTPQQRSALEHIAGDLLVSAAAGSGKTAVLAERCVNLICAPSPHDGPRTGIENLLVLTFTEAAATEMRSRISAAINARLHAANTPEQSRWLRRQAAMVERASISTLHAFCSRVLRQHFHEAQIDPAFDLIDEDEAILLREETLDDLFADQHQKNTPGFDDFFESYAQGRDSNARDILLRFYRMLASSADPAAYIVAAKARYAEPNLATTVNDFIQNTLLSQLRVLGLAVNRAITQLHSENIPATMLPALQDIAQKIQDAILDLHARGPSAIEAARLTLDYPWPTLRAPKESDNFDALKKQCWEPLKKDLKKFVDESLAFSGPELLANLRSLAPYLDTLVQLVEEFTTRYTAAKRNQNRLDFSDLERFTLTLLTNPDSLAAPALRSRYHYLLVDEFQDINPLQAALLNSLRSPTAFNNTGNLFVVGDVKQSIYGFRLAEPQLFLDKESAAKKSNTNSFVALPHNFRSDPTLLAAMNGLFEKILTSEVAGITYNADHALQPPPSSNYPLSVTPPLEVALVVMDNEEDDEDSSDAEDADLSAESLTPVEHEARMVAKRIQTLIEEKHLITDKSGTQRPLEYRDIAILLRAMKNKAPLFTRALTQQNIPVHADLSTGYFDAPEVRDTLALLQILDNPQQDIPLATLLLGPYARFTHNDLAILRLAYDKKLVPFHQAVTLYIADHKDDLTEKLKKLFATLDAWRTTLRIRPLHEALADIYADSHILPYLAAQDSGPQRIANLHSLHQRTLKFANFRKQGLHRFLRFIEKLQDQNADFGEAPILSEASNVVRIMSIHKSKGLEFPLVFLSALGSPLNLTDPGPIYIHRELHVGLQVADLEKNIFYPSALSAQITHALKRSSRAEELRLLYVALTRAQSKLILTGHLNKQSKLDTFRAQWSRCQDPLPEDLLLRARTSLDWLLPALACANIQIQWPEEAAIASAKIKVTIHSAAPARTVAPLTQIHSSLTEKILAGLPLENIKPSPALPRLIERVMGSYPHHALTQQPAVLSVSQLKKLSDTADEPESLSVALIKEFSSLSNQEAIQRGLATHRVLQLLDFQSAATAAEIQAQLNVFVAQNKISQEESALAEFAGITWFLTRSFAGKRLRAAASDPSCQLHRELPFLYAAPLNTDSKNPQDWPTIRGIIDLLLINKKENTAELFDYKTDSAQTWQKNLPAYRRQLGYYQSAAAQILKISAIPATLLFLTPQHEELLAP